MNKAENIFLSPSQIIFILKAAFIGVGIISLPNSIIKIAKQDSWISCLIGSIYPLYMLLIAKYLSSKFPRDNILSLCKKCFGSIVGNILNFIFITFFIFIGTASLSGFNNLFRVYAVYFMKSYQIISTILIVIAYIAYKGIKTLGKLCEVLFYITIPIIVLPINIFKLGMFLNLKPIIGSGLGNIIMGSKETVFCYTGMEVLFLLYPFLQDKKKVIKCGLISTAIAIGIYTYTVFGDIYYLGVDISPKFIWPILTLADSIKTPVISSFRYIFVSLWALVVFKCIATYYFAAAYSLNQIVKKIPVEAFTLMLYPVFFSIAMMYGNSTTRANYVDKITPMYIIYNLLYVTVIAFVINLKKGDINEKV